MGRVEPTPAHGPRHAPSGFLLGHAPVVVGPPQGDQVGQFHAAEAEAAKSVADHFLARLELGLYHLGRACLTQSLQVGCSATPRHNVETRIECAGVLCRSSAALASGIKMASSLA